MGNVILLALRIAIGVVLAGSLFVQGVLVLDRADVPTPLAVFVVLGLVTLQIASVCVWRLLSMVRTGTVFSPAAFRYVDIIFGAIAAASLLTFALAIALAPGEAPPGIVLITCGASVVFGGMALIVLVLRMLLDQALAFHAEKQTLQDELDTVI